MADQVAFSKRRNEENASACGRALKRRITGIAAAACLVVLLLASARTGYSASPSMGAILEKVNSVYSHLQNYRIVAVLTNNLMGPNVSYSRRTVIKLDAGGSGRIRLALTGDGPNVVIVSDGKTTWHYVPGKNEYTEREAVALSAVQGTQGKSAVRSGLLGRMQDFLVDRFGNLQGSAKDAVFKGKARVKLDGRKLPCYRIALQTEGITDELWIDQLNFLVLRENIFQAQTMENPQSGPGNTRNPALDSTFPHSMGHLKGNAHMTGEFRVTDIQVHSVPSPSLFTFTPPAGAKRVVALDMPAVLENLAGFPVKNFTLRDVEGKQVTLSDFRGKTVLLSFWASWCLPCRHELPTIQRIYEQHKDKDVVVLAVDDESPATIKKFLNDNHYGFTTLMDQKRMLFEGFAINFIPTVFVINPKGVIVREIIGWQGPQQLLSALKAGEQ